MKGAKSAYDAWHTNAATSEDADQAILHPWHRTVLRRLPDLSGRAVAEIGCGRGDFAIRLAQQFPSARITAVDFSDSAIAMARERASSAGVAVDFRTDDAERLSIPDMSFDWVVSCECLEHVLQPQSMAREIRRILRPGGRFILTTENYFNGMLLAWLKSWWSGTRFDSGSGVQPHENFFLFWRLRRLLETAGLRVQHMESNHFQWLLLPRCAPARLCTTEFRSPTLNRLFRPFGRHFTFEGVRA